MKEIENYFRPFRENIIGIDQEFTTPYGLKKIIYADWIASGRLYSPIEKILLEKFGPFVGNTHSELNETGKTMTMAYHEAKKIIKDHVNAGQDDVIIFSGYGMTAAINKFQRILGFKIPEKFQKCVKLSESERPIVFLTHMEHHSNQTSWLETICDVEIIEPDKRGMVDLAKLEDLLKLYSDRKIKIGSFTAASNVTGIMPPYFQMAKLMHEYGGLCFIDFAASAPYVDINMHPKDPLEKLDAIFFSPHKFLGGPGTSGVLIFDSHLYKLKVPDQPGGGTVDWTNPWGGHQYVKDIESREDGGTPGFLQALKTALVIRLKEKMDVKMISNREEELKQMVFDRLTSFSSIHILAHDITERLGFFSFYVENYHYNLIVKLLNDKFGVQVRGGCSCAGTYGHYLLHVIPTRSKRITDQINKGDLSEKPGWVRFSVHPTMMDSEVNYILDAIEEVIKNAGKWKEDYNYSPKTNEFYHKSSGMDCSCFDGSWFNL